MAQVTIQTISNGDAADATKAMANWTSLQTGINSIDATNCNASFAKDVVEPAFSGYKEIVTRDQTLTGASATTYVLNEGNEGTLTPNVITKGAVLFYVDPADFTAGTRATKYRVRASLYTNATAPTVTFTVGLYPVSSVAGAAGVLNATLGTVTAGSTVAFTTPTASSVNQNNSGDFTAPTAGHFALGVAVSGAQAANSFVVLSATLQVRQV